MEKIKQFENALKSLEDVLEMEYSDVIRDSVIKRFEYCFDLAWKNIKIFLYDYHGVVCNSPKMCFRKFFQLGYFSETETEDSIKMTDSRNSIVHIYLEKLANKTYADIKNNYCNLLKKIFKTVKNQTQE